MEITRPRAFIFVLMPFTPAFDDIYQLGIKPACTEAGAYCERVDEQIFEGTILQRIYNQIAKADIVVSDMTGRNPNVFYETGYAHALGKRVILLTQQADDIPFDLKHYAHIVYEGRITNLKTELEKRVRWWIENPDVEVQPTITSLEMFIEGIAVEGNPTIEVEEELAEGMYQMSLNFSVHNRSSNPLDGSRIEIGLLGPKSLRSCLTHRTTILPDNQCLIALDAIGVMPPEFWKPIELRFRTYFQSQQIPLDTPLECVLKVFTAFGVHEFPFTLILRSG